MPGVRQSPFRKTYPSREILQLIRGFPRAWLLEVETPIRIPVPLPERTST